MTTSNPSYLWDVVPQRTTGVSHRSTTSSRHPGRTFEGTVAYEITRIVLCDRCGLSRALMAALIYARGRAFFREWGVMRSNEGLRLLVQWTRIAPRSLDDDNLRSAFKPLRDELAKHAGMDDRSPRYEWQYQQERGKPGFRVHLEVIGVSDR